VGKENTGQTRHIFLSGIFLSRKTVNWRMKLAKVFAFFVLFALFASSPPL
jgi:hypothetical protein